MMTAGIKFLLLVYFASILTVFAQVQGPFTDPDPDDDSVTVSYAGAKTTIRMKENNEKDLCVAKSDQISSPNIIGTVDSSLGLSLTAPGDDGNWCLTVANVQDYDKEGAINSYNFNVMTTGLQYVELYIDNIDDEEPYFDLTTSRCQIEETFVGETTECKVTVYDADGILNGMQFQVLESGEEQSKIALTEAGRDTCAKVGYCIDVVIEIKEHLDFLENPVHSLILQATDIAGNSGNISYMVQVIPINKQPPAITPEKVEIKVDEGTSGLLNTELRVEDYDSGTFGQFSIELQDVSSGDCFEAFNVIPNGGYLNTSVTLTITKPELIDYESENCTPQLVFKIVATERADPSNIGTAEVTINIQDINDEYPIFEKETYDFSIEENTPIDTVIDTVIAIDKDESDTIKYSLSGSSSITVDELSGTVKTAITFDYERQTDLTVNLRAVDANNHIGYSQINLKIEDINDEKPELYMPTSQPSISETSKKGFDLESNIRAIDPDTNAALEFFIDWSNSRATKQGVPKDLSEFEGCIELEVTDPSAKNDVTTKLLVGDESKLDWVKYDTLSLAIVVEDKNTDANYESNKNNTATLTINIIDENTNPPVFSSTRQMSVKENTPSGSLVGFVVAQDNDGPGNNEITYSITCDEPEMEYVIISPDSGQIYTGKDNIDSEALEKPESLTCIVIASDGLHEPNVSIDIIVNDENDNTPYFLDIFEDTTVEEQTDEITIIYEILADDDDLTSPNNLVYFRTNSSMFTIDKVNGTFYLQKGFGSKLDYDAGDKEFYVEIIINDYCEDPPCTTGEGSKSNSTVIIIRTKDINDNDPIFEAVEDIQITENVKKDDLITKVIATDIDEGVNKDLTYEIVDVTCINCRNETECGKNLFTLADIAENTVNLRAAQDFRDCWGDYTVSINATDAGKCEGIDNLLCKSNREGTGIYNINIEDINNNEPKFQPENPPDEVEFNVENNTVAGELIDVDRKQIMVKATDELDREDFGSQGIEYNLIGDETAKEYFRLTDVSYPEYPVIELIKGFTNDTKRKFQIIISACDANCGENSMTTEKTTNVTLWLVGKYPPTFDDRREWESTFRENVEGHEDWDIIEVDATDVNNEGEDILEDIFYYIMPVGEAANLFALDKVTKNLTLQSSAILDRETTDNYTIYVAASNHETLEDNVLEASILTVYIKVEDVIDEPPKFNQTLFTGGISYGDKSGLLITTVYAEDEDIGDELTYEISGNIEADSSLTSIRTPFVLTKSTGELKLNFDVGDRSLKGTFTFTVEVKDLANLTNTTTVKVHMITDDNFLVFTFSDPRDKVVENTLNIENAFKKVLKYESRVRTVAASSQSRAADSSTDEWTDVTAYFVDSNEDKPIPKDEIRNLVNAQDTFNDLTRELMLYDLHLRNIESPEESTDSDMEAVLQIILIVVSVVLGTLVIVLFAAFFIKTRSLNRRLEALSTTKFGSQDSGLNRIGMAVPNTNKHAIEGSNPVWGNEDVVNRGFDNQSISSGDSDLIGVEENPEFRTGNITPDLEAPRRPTGHPILGSDGIDFSQFSSEGMNDLEAETVGRRPSVNPLAGSNLDYMKQESDLESEAESARSSNATMEQNSNFSFLKRTDSTPTTEL